CPDAPANLKLKLGQHPLHRASNMFLASRAMLRRLSMGECRDVEIPLICNAGLLLASELTRGQGELNVRKPGIRPAAAGQIRWERLAVGSELLVPRSYRVSV